MATNIGVLLNVKNQAFVDDVLSKTRDNGLRWQLINPNVYQVSLCQPSACRIPADATHTWTFIATRNLSNVGPDNNYNYYLEVKLDGYSYLTISSINVDQVETLYKQIDLLVGALAVRAASVRRVIKFLSVIPTDPATPVTEIFGQGGVSIGGSATYGTTYSPPIRSAGTVVGGSAVVVLIVGDTGALRLDSAVTANPNISCNASSRVSATSKISGKPDAHYAGQAAISGSSELSGEAT